jgi:O-antigen/teichoic acid export membrane protein
MSARRVFRNAVFSAAQTVLNAGALFWLYRYISHTLSVADLGLWSLVIASTALGWIADFGIGAGVIRFVAQSVAARDEAAAARTVSVSLASVAVLVGVGCLVVYPVAVRLLGLAIATPAKLAAGIALLPWALASLWVGALASIGLSALAGCQLMGLRAVLSLAGVAVQLGAAFALLQRLGMAGLGVAQVAQSAVTAVLSVAAVAIHLRQPVREWATFERARLSVLLRYGGALQIGALAQMFYEPLLKGLLSAFGSLELVGFYEMASRMVVQFRAVIISAYGALVPHAAGAATDDASARALYRRAQEMMVVVAPPYFAALAVGCPLVLTLWLGRYDARFVEMGEMLTLGWGLNTLSSPAYLMFLGTGLVRWPVASHIVVGIATAVFGSVLGVLSGGVSVVAGATAGIVVGSIVCPVAYHLRFGLQWRDFLARDGLVILCASTLVPGVYVAWLSPEGGASLVAGRSIVVGALACALVCVASALTPTGRRCIVAARRAFFGAARPG